MSLFVFDTEAIATQLLPPILRRPKMIAWLKVILNPVKWVTELFLYDYTFGSTYPKWAPSTVYIRGNIVTWETKENYMCIQDNPGPNDWPSGKTTSSLFWLKIQDNFIGLDERVTYNAQIIKLEQQLNRWYRINAVPYAFVNNTPLRNQFLMGENMADLVVNNPVYSSAYMCNDFVAVRYDFTVYVPETAFSSVLVPLLADRMQAVRQFVDQYKVPGTSYDVVIYPVATPPVIGSSTT